MNMKYIALTSCLLLSACSTFFEGSLQPVSFKTAGAEDALCTVTTGENDYKYVVRPPQTIQIQKSRKPMLVSCQAPGNRMMETMVNSGVAGSTFANIFNGTLGAGYDATSGAMFKYPDVVTIDFTGVVAQESPLPSYENAGALSAQSVRVENMGPKNYKLDGDEATAALHQGAWAEDARQQAEDAAADAERQSRIENVEGGFYGDKGHLPPLPVPPSN